MVFEDSLGDRVNDLHPCVWYRLTCAHHGECYVAIAKGSSPEAECPKCHTLFALDFVCFGMTTAPLPHFGKMKAPDDGWHFLNHNKRQIPMTQ